jgi:hypothetical protein
MGTLKNAVFWDAEPCEFIINRRLGGTCRLRLHGRRNNASEENCYSVTNRLLQFGGTESTDVTLWGGGGRNWGR